jgi:hypothetical protein
VLKSVKPIFSHVPDTVPSLYAPGRNRVDDFKKYAVKKLKANYPKALEIWAWANV